MRRFLYLNNDSLYSYISQINDGLTTKVTKTNKSSEENGKETKADINGNIDANIKVLGKGFGANLDANIGDDVSKIISNQQTDSIGKKIYDEAFDKLQKHLVDNELLKKDNTLILEHVLDGRELDISYARETIKYIQSLWGYAVRLITKTKEGKKFVIICSDQKDISIMDI